MKPCIAYTCVYAELSHALYGLACTNESRRGHEVFGSVEPVHLPSGSHGTEWLIGNYRASHLCIAKDYHNAQYDTEYPVTGVAVCSKVKNSSCTFKRIKISVTRQLVPHFHNAVAK